MNENKIRLYLSPEEKDLVLEYGFLFHDLQIYLRELPVLEGRVEAKISKSDLEVLLGNLSGGANHAKTRKTALALNDICDRIEGSLLGRFRITNL